MIYRDIKTLSGQVEYCLRVYTETRDSDITLLIKIWQLFYPDLLTEQFVPLKSLYVLPREEEVKRIRAHIQNTEKMYLPFSWGVAKQRKINENEWKIAMGYATDEGSYTPPSEIWQFKSTTVKGLYYNVKEYPDGLVCDCPGFGYKRKCIHSQEVMTELSLRQQRLNLKVDNSLNKSVI